MTERSKRCGRPPKAPEQKMSRDVRVAVTGAELSRVQARASSEGVTVAEIIRRATASYLARELVPTN